MPVQSSFVRSTRVPVLAAVLVLASTVIAGVPISVSWLPNPVPGNLPTDLKIQLDQPAVSDQTVALIYDNPGALNAAPTTGTFVDGQIELVLAVNTKPTTTEKHVFATVTTGGGSLKSDRLVINPTTIVEGFVGGPKKSEAASSGAPGGQSPEKAVKGGVPISVSFLSDTTAEPILEVQDGERSALYIQLPNKAEPNRSVLVTFEQGFDLIVEPNDLDPVHHSKTVPITVDRRGESIQIVTKPGASGSIKVKVTSNGYKPGDDRLDVKK